MLVCNFLKGQSKLVSRQNNTERSEIIRHVVEPLCLIWLMLHDATGRYCLYMMLSYTDSQHSTISGNEEFSRNQSHNCDTLSPLHAPLFTHFFSPILMILYIDSKSFPPPYQEQISLCSQKCWVLLFALYTEICWGCKLSPNICSLEWSRRGEARTGLVCMLFSVALSECVMYGFVWVCVCLCACACKWTIIQIGALYLFECFISST